MSRSMWPSMRRSGALLLAACVVLSTALARSDEEVSPKLQPKSDKKFFGKDYPNDKRPAAGRHYIFDHPYPAVQDTGDFDRDFVKDENADGGRWQAQMDYDVLRSKIRAAEKELTEAKRKLDKETGEWQESKDKLGDSRDAQEAAEKDRRKAEKAAGEAQADVNELEGGSQKDGTKTGGAVNDAVSKVNDEMSDLEECKKQLAEAKNRLKELMKEKEEHKKAKEAAKDAKEEAAKDAKEAAKDAKEAKDAEDAARNKKQEEHKKMRKREMDEEEKIRKDEKALAEDEVAQRTQEEASWKKKLVEEQSENAQATKTYEQELADVKRTEAQLKDAETRLRKFRRPPHVDNGGGVYYEADKPKSGAAQQCAHTVALLLVALGAAVIR